MIKKFIMLPVISLRAALSDRVLLFLVLLLTGLNGIAIDLYTPSLPAISIAFHVSAAMSKASISVGLIGFSAGVLTLGMMSDWLGRRSMVLAGLLLFVLASIMAVFAKTIDVFMVARFLQGAGVATAAMLSRAMLLDHFSGKQLYVAMLYTTISWGLGPVIAPFIGGYLQHLFGWQMNFIAYALYGSLTLILVVLLLPETLKRNDHPKHSYWKRLSVVFTCPQFNIYATLTALCFTQYVLYNLVGVFLVENKMGLTAITFGHTALLVGLGYFCGTLFSRFLVHKLATKHVMYLGMAIIVIADMAMFTVSLFFDLSLWLLVVPTVFMISGVGIVLPNTIAKALQPFQSHAGTAASMHGAVVMTIGFFLTSLLSHIQVHSIMPIAWMVFALWLGQVLLLTLTKVLKLPE